MLLELSVPVLLQHWCIVACRTRTNGISFAPFVPNDLSREKDKEQEIDIKEKDRWRCLLAAVAAMQSLTVCENLKRVTLLCTHAQYSLPTHV